MGLQGIRLSFFPFFPRQSKDEPGIVRTAEGGFLSLTAFLDKPCTASSLLRFNDADGKDYVLAFELSIRHFATTARVIGDLGYGSRPEMKWPLNRARVEEENYKGNGEKNDHGSSPPTYDRGLN